MTVALKEHYKKLLTLHGYSPKSLQWSCKDTQHKRFELLTQISPTLTSVLDVGCGFGDLFSYLKEKKKISGNYIGIDFVESFIKAATSIHGDSPNASFLVCDIEKDPYPTRCDFALLSGVFNNKRQDNEIFMFKTLEKMFRAVKKGIAFNALTHYVDYFDKELFYSDPLKVFDFCKRNLSRKMTLKNDYLLKKDSIPYEYTVYIYH